MPTLHRYFTSVLLAAAAVPAFAVTTPYTTAAGFLAAVQPGSYTETFSVANPAFPAPTSIPYASGSFSFTVAASTGVYTSGAIIGTNGPSDTLTVSFGTGITAVGGNFFVTDISDAFVSAAVTVTLNDGTTTTYLPAGFATYRGFTSDVAISSLTFSAPAANYASMDNLTVGKGLVIAVPEASTWAMMSLGIAGLLVAARRRQA